MRRLTPGQDGHAKSSAPTITAKKVGSVGTADHGHCPGGRRPHRRPGCYQIRTIISRNRFLLGQHVRHDPIFITVPLGFNVPEMKLDCPSKLVCVDHSAIIDLARLAQLHAPGPVVGRVRHGRYERTHWAKPVVNTNGWSCKTPSNSQNSPRLTRTTRRVIVTVRSNPLHQGKAVPALAHRPHYPERTERAATRRRIKVMIAAEAANQAIPYSQPPMTSVGQWTPSQTLDQPTIPA